MSAEQPILDKDRLTEVIEITLKAKQNNEFVFSGNYISPEEPYINLLKNWGMAIKSDKFATNAIFLTTSLIRGQKTTQFLKNITSEDKLATFGWVFEPEKVASKSKAVTEKACFEFFKPPGYCRSAILKWHHNAEILLRYGGDMRNFFALHNNDANNIAKAIYIRNRAKTWEKEDTFLGYGPKLAFLALQWISLYGLYDFEHLETLPVDFQLTRIAIQTDSLILNDEANADLVISRTLLPAISVICREKNIDPREVSQSLWALGSEGCNKKLHRNCPLNNICVRYITSKTYQRRGKFTSEDEGRYE